MAIFIDNLNFHVRNNAIQSSPYFWEFLPITPADTNSVDAQVGYTEWCSPVDSPYLCQKTNHRYRTKEYER